MSKYETPDTSCMTEYDKNHVYEPAEDSFLLLDTLEEDCALLKSIKPTIVVEVGSGSGIVSTFVAKLLKDTTTLVMCTDVNKCAAELTRKVAHHNGCHVEPVICDLVSSFGGRIRNLVDVLLFNPPYVLTPSSEVGNKDLAASWAGGINGREVIDRLLPQIGNMLSKDGLGYLVAVKENNIDDIREQLERQHLVTTVVMSRRTGPELLYTLRISRRKL